MLSLSRLALNSVQRTRIPTALSTSLLSYGIRSYSADAGPSRDESFRNKRRRQVRESVASGRTTEITDLSFLDAVTDQRSAKPSRSGGPRSGSGGFGLGGGSGGSYTPTGVGSKFDSPRFGTRRDRDTFYTDKRLREKDVKKGLMEPQSPYTSSEYVKTWISRHDAPLSDKQIEELVKLVEDLHPKSVNAAVWNLVLGLLGREKKYQRMWKAFNQMKKRGVFPSSRTYTTLLNAYAGVSHANIASGSFTPHTRPEKLTVDRVRLIYEQSQRHIVDMLRKEQGEGPDQEAETGLSALPRWPGTENPTSTSVKTGEVSVTPTNAYLKFLSRFGMWDEMQRVFVSMDAAGPLAPDTVTYQILFQTAYSVQLYRVSNPESPVGKEWADFDIGSVTRGYWDRAVRQLCPRDAPAQFDSRRQLDESLAQIALQCLAIGRPRDQRLVEKLIPHLWSLPSPSQPGVASASPSAPLSASDEPMEPLAGSDDLPLLYSNLPTFNLSVRSATSLMIMLSRIENRAAALHYGHFIMSNKSLRPEWDFPALRAAVFLFSNGRDVDAVRNVLDGYQPPTGQDGWPLAVWHCALRAARWGQDWEAALNFFRRMTHLPFGAESGDKTRAYEFKPPNGRPHDIRRRAWVAAAPHRADAVSMALLLKAAVGCGLKELRQAVAVFTHYGANHWYLLEHSRATKKGAVTSTQAVDLRGPPPPGLELSASMRRAVADRVELAKDIMDATERLTVMPTDREMLFALKDEARNVVKYYEPLAAKPKDAAVEYLSPSMDENRERKSKHAARGGERPRRREEGEEGREGRPERRDGGRREGREGGYEARPHRRFEGRSEGREGREGRDGHEGGYENRPQRRFEGREGGYEGRPQRRFEGNSEGRPQRRFEGRSEGREGGYEGRPQRRFEGRSEGRPEGRSGGGFKRREGFSDRSDRPDRRNDDRESRSDRSDRNVEEQ